MGLRDKNNRPDEVGVSTPPGQSAMDKIQEEVLQHEGDERMNVPVTTGNANSAEESQPVNEDQKKRQEASLNENALQILEPEDLEYKPIEVEDPLVVYVPRKDFIARINQQTWDFQAGVPKHIDRDLANMLLEDEDRGYVRD